MQKLPFYIFSLLVLAFCLVISTPAQNRAGIKVKLSVSASDNDIKNVVSSYLARELRELKDVDLVSDDEEFALNAIILKNQTKGGVEHGYSISVVLTEKMSCVSLALAKDSRTGGVTLCLSMIT